MAYGVSNGHVTDDVTWSWKVLWCSTVGYPSDSLASCSIIVIMSVFGCTLFLRIGMRLYAKKEHYTIHSGLFQTFYHDEWLLAIFVAGDEYDADGCRWQGWWLRGVVTARNGWRRMLSLTASTPTSGSTPPTSTATGRSAYAWLHLQMAETIYSRLDEPKKIQN